MYSIKNSLYFIFLFVFSINIFSQNSKDTVAIIGKDVITYEQFKERYLLSPQLQILPEDSTKKNFLYSLIAEKLWALEAQGMRLDTSSIIEESFQPIEKMYIRDALFKEEIEKKVKLTELDLIRGLQKARANLLVNFLFANDSSEIFELYEQLQKGISFDSLLHQRSEYELQKEPIEVEFGKAKPFLEDLVYPLEENSFSKPGKSDEGWFIFFLRKRIPSPLVKEENQTVMSKTRSILEDRKREEFYTDFYKKFFVGKKIKTNGTLFWNFADEINKIFYSKKEKHKENAGTNIYLDYEDYQNLKLEFKDSLNSPFVYLDDDSVKFKDFLISFFFEGFYVDTVDSKIIEAKLNSRVKYFIEQELLTREGLKRGLQNNEEVKNSIKMWKDYFLANAYKFYLQDSIEVSENEAYKYFLETQNNSDKKVLINIIEIVNNDLSTIETVLNQLNAGSDFKELVKKYSNKYINDSLQIETGLVNPIELGEIGRIALTLNIGDVYGPIKMENDYVIFKLIDKKGVDNFYTSFEESKNKIIDELKTQKYNQLIIDKTVEFAKKYNIKMNTNLILNDKEMENLRMVVFRMMGFGGRIPAVPYTNTFIEWFEKYNQQTIQNP